MWWQVIIAFAVLDGIAVVHGEKWPAWSKWNACSRSCKQGVRQRTRRCPIGIPGTKGCRDQWTETELCTLSEDCPAPVQQPPEVPTHHEDKTRDQPNLQKKKKDKNCFDPSNLDSYRGKKSKTMSGIKCQKWSKDKPWEHNYNPKVLKSKNLKKNYCRNPDNDKRPWCFSSKKKLQWDYCDVPICKGTEVTTATMTTQPGATTPAYDDVCGLPEYPMLDARKFKGAVPTQKETRVVAGVEASVGSIPWMVSLQRKTDGKHVCGGSFYKKKWVITAAHCVPDTDFPIAYQAVLGDHFLNETEKHELKMKLVNITVHENYTEGILEYDIAILELEFSVHFTDFISPICLPVAGEIPQVKDKVTVSGWGSEYAGGNQSNALLELTMNVISNEKCAKRFPDTLICAGKFRKGGKGPCEDDDGGPLFSRNDDEQYELIGITAWSAGCGKSKQPGIFTRVSHFIDWIEDITT